MWASDLALNDHGNGASQTEQRVDHLSPCWSGCGGRAIRIRSPGLVLDEMPFGRERLGEQHQTGGRGTKLPGLYRLDRWQFGGRYDQQVHHRWVTPDRILAADSCGQGTVRLGRGLPALGLRFDGELRPGPVPDIVLAEPVRITPCRATQQSVRLQAGRHRRSTSTSSRSSPAFGGPLRTATRFDHAAVGRRHSRSGARL